MKRFAALILAVVLSFTCAVALGEKDSFVLSASDSDVLFDSSGNPLTTRGQYKHITSIGRLKSGKSIYAAYEDSSDDNVTLLDGKANVLSKDEYEMVYTIGDGCLYAVKNWLTGAMDEDFNEILPCEYTQLVYNGVDGFMALSSDPFDEKSDGVYFVSKDGNETATGVKVKYGLGMFYEGLMPVVDASNSHMGYLTVHGEWGVPSQYDYAGEFVNGVAEAALSAGSGYIDKNGDWLITPKYAQVSRSGGSGNVILVQENTSTVSVLDPKTFQVKKTFTGEDIFFSAFYDIDMALVYLDDCTLLLGSDAETLMECDIDAEIDAWAEMGDRFILRQGNWGEKCMWLCDMSGNRLTEAYQEINYLGSDATGALFACSTFDVLNTVDDQLGWYDTTEVENTRLTDIVDLNGKVLLNGLKYTSVQYDECGLFLFSTETKVGAIDKTGKLVCEIDY